MDDGEPPMELLCPTRFEEFSKHFNLHLDIPCHPEMHICILQMNAALFRILIRRAIYFGSVLEKRSTDLTLTNAGSGLPPFVCKCSR